MAIPGEVRKAREASGSPAAVLLSFDTRFRLEPGELGRLARAAQEASPAEWERVIDEALFRGTGGILCHHLRTAGAEPPAALQEEYRNIAFKTVADEAALARLGAALGTEGVEVLLIKGAALKGLIYPNPGLRPADDSDWVVRTEADWAAACRVLAAQGYKPWDDAARATWQRAEFTVELHRSVLGDERVPARLAAGESGSPEEAPDPSVWARSQPAPQGEPFRMPAPEDHLLILCTHLMKHSFEPGFWFADVEGLLSAAPGMDWAAVLSRAQAWGLLRPLAYTFRSLGVLGEERFGAPVLKLPQGVREVLEKARPGALDRLLLALAGSSTRLRGEKEEWERPPVANLLWLSSRKGFGAKLGLLWEAAFPRHEVMAQIYSGYRPGLRFWFLLRRTGDLIRLACRIVLHLGR